MAYAISMNKAVCKVSASTVWMGTNFIRRGRCPVFVRELCCIATSIRNLKSCFPASLPSGRLPVSLLLADTAFGFTLTTTDEDDNSVTLSFPYQREFARTPQADNLRTQLGKLGNTPFEACTPVEANHHSPETGSAIEIRFSDNWFLPASVVAEWRRQIIEKLITARRINYRRELAVWKPTTHLFPLPETSHKPTVSGASLTYLGNVMNTRAASFYADHGIASVAPAYEKQSVPGAVLMFCKHCLRYSMGWCPTYQKGRSPYREPYYLSGTDGKRFRLEFDCKNCQMKVYAE